MADLRKRRIRQAGTALAAALAVFALAGHVDSTCRCGSGRLELVFVLDTTSSMKAVIGTVRAQCAKIITVLEGHVENLKLGVVLYKTTGSPDVTRLLPLTADRKSVVEFLGNVKTSGGGFEAVEEGLRVAVDDVKWSRGARKVVVIVGDEAPAEENEHLLYEWARAASDRGIVVNTITGSETAWRYFKITHEAEFQTMRDQHGERIKKDFRLPVFVKTAELGGGRAVGGQNVREIVRWLLSFGLGREVGKDDSVDMNEFLRWKLKDKAEGPGPGGAGRHLMARLAYRGAWRTPRDFAALRGFLAGSVRLEARSEVPDVRLSDEGLQRHALLYVSGHGPVELSDFEKEALTGYVRGGGSVWADACCGSAEFDRSFRAVVKEAFGEDLSVLGADHPVYSVGYRIGKVKVCKAHRSTEMKLGPPKLEGLVVDGRTAIIYSRLSLGHTWKSYRFGLPCMVADDDGRRLSANILLYFMTR